MKKRVRALVGVMLSVLLLLELFGWDALRTVAAEIISVNSETEVGEASDNDYYVADTGTLTVTNEGVINGAVRVSGGKIVNNGTVNEISLPSGTLENNGTVNTMNASGGTISNNGIITTLTLSNSQTLEGGTIQTLISNSSATVQVNEDITIGTMEGAFTLKGSGTLEVTNSLKLSSYSTEGPVIKVTDSTMITVTEGMTLPVRYNGKDYSLTKAKTATIKEMVGNQIHVSPPDASTWVESTPFLETTYYLGGETATAVYTAADGYYFPEEYAAQTDGNGTITTTRDSAKQITVTYTFAEADTEKTDTITLPAATAKETQDAPDGLAGGENCVTGVTTDMEYAASADAATWTSCTPVSGKLELTAGTWYFRYKETEAKYASDAVAVLVTEKEAEQGYIQAPNPAYTVSGTKGSNGYYISNVKISAPEGYLLSESENGTYQNSLTITETKTVTKIYLARETDGAKTEAIALESFLIDTTLPTISAKNNALFYGNTAEVTIYDKNLSYVLVNGVQKKLTSTSSYTAKLTSENGKKTYEITAVDKAGNSRTSLVSVAADWLKSGVVTNGTTVNLSAGSAYKLGEGTWKVSGDDTAYSGNQTFYVGSDGTYQFEAQ